jgi:SAM-dependent methyltransferase
VTNISDNAGQVDYWNRAGARRWIDNLDILDQLLRPVSTRLMAAARAEAGERVIDVGCGSTTIDFAARVSPGGEALGLDISAPMLERARERAPAGLAVGDAASHELTPGWADLVDWRSGIEATVLRRSFARLHQSAPGPADFPTARQRVSMLQSF